MMIELDQSQIVTALIASSTACIVMLVGEFFRHKNSLSKTVQDKLHYDRSEVIRELFKKLIQLDKFLKSSYSVDPYKNIQEFSQMLEDYENYFDENTIYFDHESKIALIEIQTEFVKFANDFLVRVNSKNLSNDQELSNTITNKIPIMRMELEKSF